MNSLLAAAGARLLGFGCEEILTALRQFSLAAEDKGEHIACLEARRHFAWYLRGVPHSGIYKKQVVEIESLADAQRIAALIKMDLR